MHVTLCLITPTPMSNILPPLLIPATDRENSEAASMISLPPLSSWSGGHRAFSSFSSPPPSSSSPPMTPFTKESHIYTHIQSSPDVPSDHGYYAQRDRSDNSLTWDHNDVHIAKAIGTNRTLPSFKSTFVSESSIPLPSRYDASALYDGVSTHFHENPSYGPRPPHSNVFYDSEEEGQDEDDGFSAEEDRRATFFRTSAERGQWRYDPIPVKPHARSQMRKSIPNWSPDAFPGLQLVSRPISEPAPSTSRMQSPSIPPDSHEDVSELAFPFPMSSDHQSMMRGARQSLPSLMSDRDTSPEQEEMHLSSPLPPSSPPLSHLSFPRSPTARSISPLSFAPSSPPPVPSSPLAFGSSDDSIELDEETGVIPLLADHPEAVPVLGSEPTAARPSASEEVEVHPPIAHDPEYGVSSSSPIAIPSSSSLPSLEEIPAVAMDIQAIPVALEEPSSPHRMPIISQNPSLEFAHTALPVSPVDPLSDAVKCEKESVQSEVASGDEALPGHDSATGPTHMTSDVGVEADLLRDEFVGGSRAISVESKHDVETSDRGMIEVKVVTVKRKKQIAGGESDGLPKKKACVRRGTSKYEGKRRLEDWEPGVSDVKKQKKNDGATASGKQARRPSHSHSCSDPSPSTVNTSSGPSSSKPQQHGTDSPELDAEITGMLIECMATSRASSLPISSLLKSVMQCRPSLKAQRSEKEWVAMFRRVLKDGVAGCGVFGKVESSGKDDSDRPLEAQWFYVPERDSDQERATLIRSMMPRPSKRTETKKYKQYYYRPLEKISRWDAEDDI